MKKIADIKKNPFVLLKKPWLIAMVPFYLFSAFRKRWNSSVLKIYITETIIKNHQLTKLKAGDSILLERVDEFAAFEPLFNRRVKESFNDSIYRKEIVNRFTAGDFALVLFNNILPVAYLFVSEREISLAQFGYREKLPEKCFAIYDVYTFSDYRSKGFYSILLSETVKIMQNRGYERFRLWLMEHNQISVKVHDNLKINTVIAVYSEWYRYGFRRFSKQETKIPLFNLIHK